MLLPLISIEGRGQHLSLVLITFLVQCSYLFNSFKDVGGVGEGAEEVEEVGILAEVYGSGSGGEGREGS